MSGAGQPGHTRRLKPTHTGNSRDAETQISWKDVLAPATSGSRLVELRGSCGTLDGIIKPERYPIVRDRLRDRLIG